MRITAQTTELNGASFMIVRLFEAKENKTIQSVGPKMLMVQWNHEVVSVRASQEDGSTFALMKTAILGRQ